MEVSVQNAALTEGSAHDPLGTRGECPSKSLRSAVQSSYTRSSLYVGMTVSDDVIDNIRMAAGMVALTSGRIQFRQSCTRIRGVQQLQPRPKAGIS